MHKLRLGGRKICEQNFKKLGKFLEREEVILAQPKLFNPFSCGPKMEEIFTYLIGQDYVMPDKISPEMNAQIVVLVFYWAQSAFDSWRLPRQTISQRCINADNSTRVTPPGVAKMPKGLTLKSQFYFSVALSEIDSSQRPKRITGSEIVLTDAGLYHWSYRYKMVFGASKKYPRNLRDTSRYVAEKSVFTVANVASLTPFFYKDRKLAFKILDLLRTRLRYDYTEARRIARNIHESIDKINAVFSRVRFE